MDKSIVVRIARPTNNHKSIANMYKVGLDFKVLAKFENHDKFDGIILGNENSPYHLEFTHYQGTLVDSAPTKDNLIIFYIMDKDEWKNNCRKMIRAGFENVKSFNPYWDNYGKTIEDPDGYKVVLQNKSWDL